VSHVQSKFRVIVYTFFVLIALSACQNQKEPAQKAIADIETAVTAAGADAERYIGAQVKAVKDGVAALKAKFEKKDYKGVLADAPALMAKAQGLTAAKDAAIKEETARQAAEKAAAEQVLKSDWETLASTVPSAIEAVDSRVGVLAKSKKLPANLTKEELASAQSNLAEAKTLWDQASSAQAAGNVRDAVTSAQQAKEKVDAALAGLDMTTAG
jgi:hypothetical protein